MPRITEDELARIKHQVDVADLCRGYGIELKQMGPDNLMGRCPFHDDHTPSFGVTPSKNLWNCLAGCGGGDAISLVMRKESEWVWHNVEPVVSEEVWDQCQAILDSNPRHPNRTKAPKQLFAGFVYCHCGEKMYVRSNTAKYICEGCRNKIPVADLEAIYIGELKDYVFTPGEIAAHIEKANGNIVEKERLLVVLQEKYDKVVAEGKKVYRLHMDGELDGKGFGQLYRPIQEQQEQLDNELPRLQAEVDLLKINQISEDQVLTEVQDLYNRWPGLEREDKHRVVESITEKIIIGSGEIEVNLYHVASSEELTKGLRTLLSAIPFCHLAIKARKPFCK